MKFSVAAVLAAAVTGAAAGHNNVTVVTEVVETFVTYCPEPTTITHGSSTYTVTEPTTLTITDCPCTVTKPVTTTSSVYCHTCTSYANSTTLATSTGGNPPPTGGLPSTSTQDAPTEAPTSGAAKKVGAAGLAGVAGLAALFL